MAVVFTNIFGKFPQELCNTEQENNLFLVPWRPAQILLGCDYPTHTMLWCCRYKVVMLEHWVRVTLVILCHDFVVALSTLRRRMCAKYSNVKKKKKSGDLTWDSVDQLHVPAELSGGCGSCVISEWCMSGTHIRIGWRYWLLVVLNVTGPERRKIE